MNILYDFVTLGLKTGAGEYARRVFFELLDRIERQKQDTHVYALIDSKQPVVYDDMQEKVLNKRNIKFVDIQESSFHNLIERYKIDRFFIACSQHVAKYEDIVNIRCDVVCVTHDMCIEEQYANRVRPFFVLCKQHSIELAKLSMKEKLKKMLFPRIRVDNFLKWYISVEGFHGLSNDLSYMNRIKKLSDDNPRMRHIVVSEYTKHSMIYHLGIDEKRITVLYSPERLMNECDTIINPSLEELIDSHKTFYLMVSCHRSEKNPTKALHAFQKYVADHKDKFIVTIGYGEVLFQNHIDLPFLSESDLANAYKHCYALIYPSFYEGFGYPPIEAMHYAKPVLCSDVTSIPEILCESPIYFSPMYENSIFMALNKLNSYNYDYYCKQSFKQYSIIRKRQDRDLSSLIDIIISTNMHNTHNCNITR